MLNQPGVSIVRDGQARAVVVTAARPSQVVAYAVDELVSHVEKATGRRLPAAVGTDAPQGLTSRIFVGFTEAALKQGIDPGVLLDGATELGTRRGRRAGCSRGTQWGCGYRARLRATRPRGSTT